MQGGDGFEGNAGEIVGRNVERFGELEQSMDCPGFRLGFPYFASLPFLVFLPLLRSLASLSSLALGGGGWRG